MSRSDPTSRDEAFVARDRDLAQRMARSQAGDADAYRALLEEVRWMLSSFHSRALKRFGFFGPERVEDLVQETLLALHRKRHTFDPSQPFGPWLFAIARYKLIDHSRRARREIPLADLDGLEDALLARDDGDAAAKDLDRALASLKDKPREILEQIKVEGLSVREASERHRMSESAIKVTVHRAIRSLKDRFRKELEP